ncbi:hypothetical protein [Priestia megaterium]|uniref:hypothetical protein n=1 Tax=Priestia megaterium TaxID=1404 RepID=UPI000BFDD743|nr:hypothetical protein [Priestia megaterium]PGO60679.1 hypothetical protein CN981_09010 [Priestia megaterium]
MNTMTEKQFQFLNQLENTFNTINNFTQVEHDDMSDILESNIDDMKRELENNDLYQMVKKYMKGELQDVGVNDDNIIIVKILHAPEEMAFGYYWNNDKEKTFYMSDLQTGYNDEDDFTETMFEVLGYTQELSKFMRIDHN